jgi:hypothetical protein
MSLLTVCQDVCKVIALDVPATIINNEDREIVELLALAQEMADRIASGHEWQKFSTVCELEGDGDQEDFDLPENYDRMLVDDDVWSSTLSTTLTPIKSLNQWLGMEVTAFDFVLNSWIIFGGQMHIKPALATGATAKYFYQSNEIISEEDGFTYKAEFEADTDSFRLKERVLKLGMIWQWRANKGLAYAEDMANYEAALAREVMRDRGARMLRIGGPRMPRDVTTAYPRTIEV